MRFTILVVDDDPHVLELLKFTLEKENHRVVTAADGHAALQLAAAGPDLILLDLMLPGIDGYEVCRRLKADPRTAAIPVVMLTARAAEVDRVLGLELGADDYVTKPFSLRELVARIRARLLRCLTSTRAEETELRYGDLVIRPGRFEVFVGDREVRLTAKEFALVHHLAAHPNVIFTRNQLLSTVWGYPEAGNTRTVDVHIRYLRRKIEPDPDHPRLNGS